MLQAAICDGGQLDAFAFGEDRLRSAEVNVGRCHVVDARGSEHDVVCQLASNFGSNAMSMQFIHSAPVSLA